ncbi:hypothetical protein C8Q76DRAFT_789687 [Earliella scabrosa]|nr:hypothetical protein C8Q76DRAFT_789687 [Earliella scabrosa]
MPGSHTKLRGRHTITTLSAPRRVPYSRRPVPERPLKRAPLTLEQELKNIQNRSRYILTCDPVGDLNIVPYPASADGQPVPVGDLLAYDEKRSFTDNIVCFCTAIGKRERAVRLFIPLTGDHEDDVCIGCRSWRPDGRSGCMYFVNLTHLFGNGITPGAIEPLELYPLRNPAEENMQYVTPGYLYDHYRLYSPPPPDVALQRVEDQSLWPSPDVAERAIHALLDAGVSYNDLIASLGHCMLCGKVMAIHRVLNHYCVDILRAGSPVPKGDGLYGLDLPFAIGVPAPASAQLSGGSGTDVDMDVDIEDNEPDQKPFPTCMFTFGSMLKSEPNTDIKPDLNTDIAEPNPSTIAEPNPSTTIKPDPDTIEPKVIIKLEPTAALSSAKDKGKATAAQAEPDGDWEIVESVRHKIAVIDLSHDGDFIDLTLEDD